MQSAYYEDFREIEKKIWSMFNDAVTNRNSTFKIPVFVCGDQKNIEWLYLAAKGHRKGKFEFADSNKEYWLAPLKF